MNPFTLTFVYMASFFYQKCMRTVIQLTERASLKNNGIFLWAGGMFINQIDSTNKKGLSSAPVHILDAYLKHPFPP